MPDDPSLPRLDPKDYGYGRFAPRIWHGMTFQSLARLLRGNLGRITPDRYGVVASALVLSLGNSFLKAVSDLIYGRRLARVRIDPDPVFILGYWRSGTTWLNQLLACDPRFASPTGLQVFMPDGFLVARWGIKPFVGKWLPETRPMDNVALTVDTAEEDEVALAISGAPSILRSAAFPGHEVSDAAPFLSDLNPQARARWAHHWDAFLRKVQFVNPSKWLLLKSPGHTTRLPEILRRFPNARFIYITRDPYKILQSATKTRLALSATQGLSSGGLDPDDAARESFRRFRAFHDKFFDDQHLIPQGSLSFVKYEDLRENPVAEMRRIYDELGLGGFDTLEPRLRGYLDSLKGYQTNSYTLDPKLEERIWHEARAYFDRFGYQRLTDRPEVPA
ncbi:sulfotransferase family protein [Aestuariivita boseongensis]|uniref:sulfotransferase family protein n=1 Tax=Aestuariivita boseongensis TaxID=1470562 RepID=UPI0006813E49|nr:sulfotransferase [Aestuariivita boseongensis]